MNTKNSITQALALGLSTLLSYTAVAKEPSSNKNKAPDALTQKVRQEFRLRDVKDLPEFVQKLKTITVYKDAEDDVINKIGEPTSKNVLFGLKVWRYDFSDTADSMQTVVCMIDYNAGSKVSNVSVTKAGMGGVEQIYSQGTPMHGPNAKPPEQSAPQNTLPQSLATPAAPASPNEGQIYFNISDKHFYGWNGSEWKQLD